MDTPNAANVLTNLSNHLNINNLQCTDLKTNFSSLWHRHIPPVAVDGKWNSIVTDGMTENDCKNFLDMAKKTCKQENFVDVKDFMARMKMMEPNLTHYGKDTLLKLRDIFYDYKNEELKASFSKYMDENGMEMDRDCTNDIRGHILSPLKIVARETKLKSPEKVLNEVALGLDTYFPDVKDPLPGWFDSNPGYPEVLEFLELIQPKHTANSLPAIFVILPDTLLASIYAEDEDGLCTKSWISTHRPYLFLFPYQINDDWQVMCINTRNGTIRYYSPISDKVLKGQSSKFIKLLKDLKVPNLEKVQKRAVKIDGSVATLEWGQALFIILAILEFIYEPLTFDSFRTFRKYEQSALFWAYDCLRHGWDPRMKTIEDAYKADMRVKGNLSEEDEIED